MALGIVSTREHLPSNRPSINIRQPNHHLILLRPTRSIAREQIIRNIRNEIAARVRPAPSRRDRLDLRDLHIVRLNDDIREALDAVLAAGPRPGGVPLDHRAALAVECGALATGGGGTLAPEVVVESVSAGLDEVPIYVERQSLLSNRNVKFRGIDVPPHMGSPTARRSMGVGEAADNKPSDAVRAVVVNFILSGRGS